MTSKDWGTQTHKKDLEEWAVLEKKYAVLALFIYIICSTYIGMEYL